MGILGKVASSHFSVGLRVLGPPMGLPRFADGLGFPSSARQSISIAVDGILVILEVGGSFEKSNKTVFHQQPFPAPGQVKNTNLGTLGSRSVPKSISSSGLSPHLIPFFFGNGRELG